MASSRVVRSSPLGHHQEGHTHLRLPTLRRIVISTKHTVKVSGLKEYADPASVDEAIELLNNVNCLDKPMKVQRWVFDFIESSRKVG